MPLAFKATPGSNFGGHHSYPGGLAVHESFNDQSSINFADTYRGEYGSLGEHHLPVTRGAQRESDVRIDQDVILAAPIWYDPRSFVFEHRDDEAAGCESASIQVGAVQKLLGVTLAGRMTVDDVVIAVSDIDATFVSEPQQVFVALNVQRDRWIHAGVNVDAMPVHMEVRQT